MKIKKIEQSKEQKEAKKFVRLFFVQAILLLVFLFFCGKILTDHFSWRMFFCFLFLLGVCGTYGWAVVQRKKGRIKLFNNVIGLGFFTWFCIVALMLN
jgi:hypothetical protein